MNIQIGMAVLLWFQINAAPTALPEENPTPTPAPAPTTVLQSASLPGATIHDASAMEGQSYFRHFDITFGERRIVAERKNDILPGVFPRDGFGKGDGPLPPIVDGSRIALAGYKKRLTEPAWLLDSDGEGFFFPAQPDLQIVGNPAESPAFALQGIDPSPRSHFLSLWIGLGKISAADLAAKAVLLINPTLAPLQITQNDDDALIVYDLQTKTTAYVLVRASERMDSAGYLSGAGQPCVVLIRSSADKLIVTAGKTAPLGTVRLKLFGDWTPAPTETAILKIEQKAGRTWVEFTAGPDGAETINLVKLPARGFLQRILELFLK